MSTALLSTTIPTYISDSLGILQERLGHKTKAATISYLLELSLIYELGEPTVEKLYQRMAEDDQRKRDGTDFKRGEQSGLYRDAQLIASAPNMANDADGIYAALKNGEPLDAFELIGA